MEVYKIYKNGKEFSATDEQSAFFDFIQHGSGNAVIQAAAGSAKTSTIENALRFIPDDKRVLFIAFNRSVRDEIKNDVSRNPLKTKISTFHGLGYNFIQSYIRNNSDNNSEDIEIYEFKYKKYIKNNINNLSSIDIESLGRSSARYINNIVRLVEYARYYCYMKPREIRKLVDVYGDIELIGDECEVAYKVLKWGMSDIGIIDYTDMIWLPYILDIECRNERYDYVFVDEAQDVTVAEERLIEKTKARGCRLIAVGDENQRINVWCGASVTAMDNFRNLQNTRIFTLSTSFRIPVAGESLVHERFPEINIHAAKGAIDGEVRHDSKMSDIRASSMVLCRTLAPLVGAMMEVTRMNKKCFLKGWETEKDLFREMVLEYDGNDLDRELSGTDGLFPKMYSDLFDMADRLMEEHGLTEEEAFSNGAVLDRFDRILSLTVLSEGTSDKAELLDKINVVFGNGDSSADAVIFSTIHRAKGLEADNVFILRPSLLPNPFAKADWQKEEERNLEYVAYTRFKKTLSFMYEDNDSRSVPEKVKISQMLADAKKKIGYVSIRAIEKKRETSRNGISKEIETAISIHKDLQSKKGANRLGWLL